MCLLASLGVSTPARAQGGAPAPPSVTRPSAPLNVRYEQFRLSNGLNVILHEDHSVPIVAVDVWYLVGSAREKPNRTGFAHLFEHLMFEGSAHVKEGEFDRWLESAGGDNNGSTTTDRTNYYITVPSNALELALFLESDRMGFLLETMSPERVNGQRDVVKNERRQSYENQPYGIASIVLDEMLYPKGHPYSWPTIGHMEDLTAASYEDVVEFFKKYYGPNNASLVIAGDIDPVKTRALVQKWFGEVKGGPFVEPIAAPPSFLTQVKTKTIDDRVQLERLYLAWVTPGVFQPGDATLDVVASVLAGGKNSRLYRRLVYELQIAQGVIAFQQSSALTSAFMIVATARPGHTAGELKTIIDEELEKLREAPSEAREIERAINGVEAGFYRQMERVGGFSGKADQLNAYYARTGDPDFFAEDLARYRDISASDVTAAIKAFLPADRRVELTVVPRKEQK